MRWTSWVCGSKALLNLAPGDTVAPLTQYFPFHHMKGSWIQIWCQTQLMILALWPLTHSSGFDPGLQSAELPLNNGSLSTINSHTHPGQGLHSLNGHFCSPVSLCCQPRSLLPPVHCSTLIKSLNLFSFAGRKCQLPEAPTRILLMTGITYCLSLFCLYLMVYWERAQFMHAPRYGFIGIPWLDALLLPS